MIPVYRGELQGPSLGAKVEAWSEAGEPLTFVGEDFALTDLA